MYRLRVKDPKASVKFYEFLGLKQINKLENPDNKFDLYFLAYDSPKAASAGKHWSDREGSPPPPFHARSGEGQRSSRQESLN